MRIRLATSPLPRARSFPTLPGMKVSAYIFDLDGTLLDTEKLWVESTALYMREHAPELTDDEVQEIVYGRSWSDVYRSICERLPELALSIDEMAALLNPIFARLREERDVRIEPSIALLRDLAATHPVCIVSGSPRAEIEYAIDLMDIRDCLRLFLGAEDYGPGKPDPSCFLLAAEKLGVPPNECIVFEDSTAGIRAAKAAGMYCIALARDGAPAQDTSAADETHPSLEHFSP